MQVPPAAWGALVFLVVASTLVGYAVFLALNARVSPTLANTFNYAAPVIALLLSALLLHEPLTIVKLASGSIALIGVALIGVALMPEHLRSKAVITPPAFAPPSRPRGRPRKVDHLSAIA